MEFIIYAILRFIYGYQVIESGSDVCKFCAFSITLFSRISLIFISVLAALRYLIVCHQIELKFITWLVITFVPSLVITLIFSLGFYTNDASPSVSYTYCFAFTQPSILSKVMSYLIPPLYIIPCWIATYCYFCVGWISYKRLNLMKQEAASNADERLLSAIKKQKIKLAIQISFIFIIYNINFSISYVTWIMKLVSSYKRTIIIDFIAVIQLNLTIFLNPIVTIIFQPDINNEFNNLDKI
jgi:hypothetical protein